MRKFWIGLGIVLIAGGFLFYNSFPPEVPDSGYQVTEPVYSHTNTLPFDNGVTYGPTPWSGAHRDSRNSDYIPLPSPDRMKRTWTGINNAAFFMPPTLGGRQHLRHVGCRARPQPSARL